MKFWYFLVFGVLLGIVSAYFNLSNTEFFLLVAAFIVGYLLGSEETKEIKKKKKK